MGLSHSFGPHFIATNELVYDLVDHSNRLVLGAEYSAMGPLSLRIGHLSNFSVPRDGDPGKRFLSIYGLVGGLGISVSSFKIDYAFTPFGQLGEVHRISIISRFATPALKTVFDTPKYEPAMTVRQPHVMYEPDSALMPYIVQPGETLESIAKKFYGRESMWRQILFYNPTVSPSNLTPGTKIFVPHHK
jgi:hypothetical protein